MSDSDDSETGIFFGPITEKERRYCEARGIDMYASSSSEADETQYQSFSEKTDTSDCLDLNNTYEEMKMFMKYGPDYARICEEKKTLACDNKNNSSEFKSALNGSDDYKSINSIKTSMDKFDNENIFKESLMEKNKENVRIDPNVPIGYEAGSKMLLKNIKPKPTKTSAGAKTISKHYNAYGAPKFHSPIINYSKILSPVAAYIYEHPVPETPKLSDRKVKKTIFPKSHSVSVARKLVRKSLTVTKSRKPTSNGKSYAVLVSGKEKEVKVPCGPKMLELIHKKKAELQFVGHAKVKPDVVDTTIEISLYEEPERNYEKTLSATKMRKQKNTNF